MPKSNLPNYLVFSITLVVVVVVGVAGALVWHGSDVTPFFMSLASVLPLLFTSFLSLMRTEKVSQEQQAQGEVLNKIEHNTNGALNSLIEKIGPADTSTPNIVTPPKDMPEPGTTDGTS